MRKIMTMRRVIFAATLAALLPTVEALGQKMIDWGQKSLSLDTGMSEDVVMKAVGQSPKSAEVGVCSGQYGSPAGVPVTCKIHLYGKNGELIVRFKKESGKWLSYSWSVHDRQ
jgi:hypothetical protein